MPTDRPGIRVLSVSGYRVKLLIYQPLVSGTRGKPAGVLGANIYTYSGDQPSLRQSDWQFIGTTTRNTYTILFPHDLAPGSQVFICANWFNRRTQPGPLSFPITTRLQGGGVEMAA